MPLLPLPPGPTPLGAGDLPFSTTDDVLALVPAYLNPSDPAIVRDAIISALFAMLVAYQERAAYAAAQSDVLRATDTYEDGQGKDRGADRKDGESDDDYRARILSIPNLVTPTAIMAAVNTILAPLTAIQAQYCESVQDRWYVRRNGNAADLTTFHSFVYGTTASRSPHYLDRLYEDNASDNGGFVRSQSNPGGARVWADTVGRFFLLRVPDLSPLDAGGSFAWNTVENTYPSGSGQPGLGMFVRSHANGGTAYGSYLRAVGVTALSTYEAICNTVNRLVGASIRWSLYVDPKLTS